MGIYSPPLARTFSLVIDFAFISFHLQAHYILYMELYLCVQLCSISWIYRSAL